MTIRMNARTTAATATTADEEVPRALRRAVALLRGGVAVGNVWRVLGAESDASLVCAAIAARIAEGEDVSVALAAADTEQWRLVAAAWRVAELSGAPMAASLVRLADALHSLHRVSERRSVLLAAPRATIRLVAALPLLALVMGFVLGFDPIGVLLSPLGAVLGLCGGLLLAAGVWWARRLTARLEHAEWVSGFEFELCTIALASGAPPADGVRRVVDSIDAAGAAWVPLSSFVRDGAVWNALNAAAAQGSSVQSVLLAEADAARVRTFAELERAAERLGVQVLIPLAVCVLPSFVVLGVLPVLFAVMGSLGGTTS